AGRGSQRPPPGRLRAVARGRHAGRRGHQRGHRAGPPLRRQGLAEVRQRRARPAAPQGPDLMPARQPFTALCQQLALPRHTRPPPGPPRRGPPRAGTPPQPPPPPPRGGGGPGPPAGAGPPPPCPPPPPGPATPSPAAPPAAPWR